MTRTSKNLPHAAPKHADIQPLFDAFYLSGCAVVFRNRIVEAFVPYVDAIAMHYAKKLPRKIDVDDLKSAANMGLMRCVERFDPSRKVTFATFIRSRVLGAMIDHLRDISPMTRRALDGHKKLEAAADELRNELNREPTDEEARKRAGLSKRHFRLVQDCLLLNKPTSLSEVICEDNGRTLTAGDMVVGNMPDPHRALDSHDLITFLIKKLPAAKSFYVIHYYLMSETMREIGETMGISESRVSQVNKGIINDIKNLMRQHDIRGWAA